MYILLTQNENNKQKYYQHWRSIVSRFVLNVLGESKISNVMIGFGESKISPGKRN